SGAYWRGGSKNKQLQRIYGTAFHSEKELKAYLKRQEEAAQNDHRLLGKKLDLFWFNELSAGSPFFTPSGTKVYQSLQNFLREKYRKYEYEEVITPQIYHSDLFESSGHLHHFMDNMFAVLEENELEQTGFSHFFKTRPEVKNHLKQPQQKNPSNKPEPQNFRGATYNDNTKFPEGFSPKQHQMYQGIRLLKPMNCPGHCLLYKKDRKSYRDLPWRVADFGRLHRREPAGALQGLTRVKSFCQDDAHIFCRPDQLFEEIQTGLHMLEDIYQTLGLNDYAIALSTRPESRMGNEALWDQAEKALKESLDDLKIPYKEQPGEGAFYGPKLDINIKDSFARPWQLGTFQCDFNLPEAFDLSYINEQGEEERPVMVHRAIIGSLERFMGVYLEHRKGRLPLWLCPTQVIILPLTDKEKDFCHKIQINLAQSGIICKIDGRNEKISYKIREAQIRQIPYMIIIGKKETESGNVSLRLREGTQLNDLPLQTVQETIQEEIQKKSLHSLFSKKQG
ncbi:MAG: threonine--tRNA ligase, partial [Bdellovibrionales bacterium]|nr:threonine--tRNA ligase [Bdellovibrionales bacterium]